MYLTISKRFEISSSARLWVPGWSAERNAAAFGPAWRAEHGCGFNYVSYLVFNGPVDADTGMLINVVTIKERVKLLLDGRYDHKFLNADCGAFKDRVPTAENLARQVLEEVRPLFDDIKADPVVCHVRDSRMSGATAYADGRVERHLWTNFSAARRTFSPHLSDSENEALFGAASAHGGHGHNYRLRITLAGEVDAESGQIADYEQTSASIGALRGELDHKNLNSEVSGLKGRPITTESLASYALERLSPALPVARVRLYELPDFFAEYNAQKEHRLGVVQSFHAAHRLDSPHLDQKRNLAVYGKCNNPKGHGHEYVVEATIGGKYDERSGTLFDFVKLNDGLRRSLEPWAYRHLDEDTDDFKDAPSTGENIVSKLWSKLNPLLDNRLERLRLWETPNNRFTLRREL
jgi:6-pyruvoyltetrahydropterin/6-carboxytetrahydropterin synthase